MKSVYNAGSRSASVDSVMTPMIDVVFLLLIFFLTTASFQKLEKQLPAASASEPESSPSGKAPQPSESEVSDFNDIVIKITLANNGVRYALQSEPVAGFDELANRVHAVLKIRSDVPVIIDPDNQVPSGEAIKVYDMVRRNGSVSVFLVAR
ncbi:MAG: biopolymer transporter ExbD [Pirellula sp.]|jgi:biopolymer transport protein ExbD|nr:biopolymer transporter ExbD [Pirellula sp.]